MSLRFGPFAFFLQVIDDTTYGNVLARALDTVIPANEIIHRGGVEVSAGDPGGNFERWLPSFRNHMLACQAIHNTLVDIRPAGSLFRIHKIWLRIVKAYAYAVADYADYCAAWAADDIDMRTARRHEQDGITWEALACRYIGELQRKWEQLQPQERQRLAEMLGSDEFPERLEKVMYPGFIWTAVLTGGH